MTERQRRERSAGRPPPPGSVRSGLFHRAWVRNGQQKRRAAGPPNIFPIRSRPPSRHKAAWAILVAALLLVAVPTGWHLTRRPGLDFRQVANLEAQGEVVLFFGDSITQGHGVPPDESFPSLVARELGVLFVNAGVPGETTAAGLARIERDVLARRPRLTVVEFGGNDFLRQVPHEETLKNLDAMVKTLIGQGMMVVILEVNVGAVSDPYLEGYRTVAQRYGAVLVEDVMRGILSNPSLKVDAIHPNARGHRRIADRVLQVLRPLLREADRRRGPLVRQSRDFPLPARRALAKLRTR